MNVLCIVDHRSKARRTGVGSGMGSGMGSGIGFCTESFSARVKSITICLLMIFYM